MDEKIIVTIVGIIGTVCSVVFGYIGDKKGLEQAYKTEGKESGTLMSDMQYIKRRIDDVLLEQRNINITLASHSERITRVEESSKQAHKRIDKIETKKGDN